MRGGLSLRELTWPSYLLSTFTDRPLQLEQAMIIFGAIGRNQVGGSHAAFVVIDSAAHLSQIRFAIEFPTDGVGLHLEVSGVREAEEAEVGGAKVGRVAGIIFAHQQAAKPAMMMVGFAGPTTFPGAFNGVFARLRDRGALPVTIVG